MFHKSCHICRRCLTPCAVSCLDMYITYRALRCPHDAVYRSEADAKRWFFHFLTWKCVCCSFFINVVPMWIYNPIHNYIILMRCIYLYSVYVLPNLRRYGKVFVSPVKVTSWSFSGTAAEIFQMPAYSHLNNQDNNVRLLSKNVVLFTSLKISTASQPTDFGHQGSRNSWPLRY